MSRAPRHHDDHGPARHYRAGPFHTPDNRNTNDGIIGRISDGQHPAADLVGQQLVLAEMAWQQRDVAAGLIDQIDAVWTALSSGSPTTGSDVATELLGQRAWAVRQLTTAADLTRAMVLGQTVAADMQRVLGPDHPNTLNSRNDLAYAYRAAGRLTDAIALYERTLADCGRVLGLDHPTTLTSRNNLASAYQAAGRLTDAIPLYKRTLADCGRVLGPDHPTTLTSRNNLADAYESAGRLTDAIPLYKRTLADMQRVLGPDHPTTLTSRNNLAAAQADLHQARAARPEDNTP